MRRVRIALLIVMLVLLAACASRAPEQGRELLMGQCSFTAQGWQFKPCDAHEVYRLVGSKPALADLAERRTRLGSQAAFYVELSGERSGKVFALKRVSLAGRLVAEDCGQQQLFGELVALDKGVIANRRTRVCYDAKGPNVDLTRLHIDKAAAAALAKQLKQQTGPLTEFAPENEAVCQTDEQLCYVRTRRNAVLSRAVYGEPPAAAAAELKGVAWKWRATLMHDESRIAPSEPERYTLRFADGGALSLKVDCNRGAGTYRLKGRELGLDVKLLTKAACGPASLERDYLKGLNSVEAYSLDDGVLRLKLRLAAGVMEFVK